MSLFDYGNITEEHKAALLEVVELAKQSNNDMFAELLKHKFQLVEPVKIDHKTMAFTQECEKVGIKVWVMGYQNNPEQPTDENNPLVPILSITEGADKMEDLVASIRSAVK